MARSTRLVNHPEIRLREPLHIALGDLAADRLRSACEAHGMPGTVLAIPDDPSHGPLDDGRARIDYMRACFRGYDDWRFEGVDAFEPWRGLIERLDAERPGAVLIWSGENLSEATFLAMACWWLRRLPENVLRVPIPEAGGWHQVTAHTPAGLAGLFGSRRAVTDSERVALSEDFVRIRGETGLLRRWEAGRITGVPIDRYDPMLAAACTPTWTPASRVVGRAMAGCDGRNLMSDIFFSSRLQAAIDSGRIEADSPRLRLREYAVRLARPST